MEVIAKILVFLFFLLACVGALSIIIPLRFLNVKSRGEGARLMLGAGVLCVVTAMFIKSPQKVDVSSAVSAPVSAVAAISAPPALRSPSDAEVAAAATPSAQRAFVEAVTRGRDRYRAGENEMQKGAARSVRAKAVCAALANRSLAGWVGQVDTLSSNGDGKGVLSVKLAPKLTVKTWNNALSDIGDRTLLDPDSPVFASAASKKVGQWVRFSGTLFADSTDCVRELSNTLAGSMGEPEYLLRFVSIEAL